MFFKNRLIGIPLSSIIGLGFAGGIKYISGKNYFSRFRLANKINNLSYPKTF
jgi:hypothetical protein